MYPDHPLSSRRASSSTIALAAALGLAQERVALADRHEWTVTIRPTAGKARIWDAGAGAAATVPSWGGSGGLRFGVFDWLDLGAEAAITSFGDARYPVATLPVSVNPFSGRLQRTSRMAHLHGTATLRGGPGWIPFLQLALGAGARYRTAARLSIETTQGMQWVRPDDQGGGLLLDLEASVRAGLERRITPRWTAGVAAAAAHTLGVLGPDLQTAELTLSISYTWYPVFKPYRVLKSPAASPPASPTAPGGRAGGAAPARS